MKTKPTARVAEEQYEDDGAALIAILGVFGTLATVAAMVALSLSV